MAKKRKKCRISGPYTSQRAAKIAAKKLGGFAGRRQAWFVIKCPKRS